MTFADGSIASTGDSPSMFEETWEAIIALAHPWVGRHLRFPGRLSLRLGAVELSDIPISLR